MKVSGKLRALAAIPAEKKTPFVEAGTQRPSWLSHDATRRKVTASIPDGVIEIFL
jgi:hypothetical protein